jgi:hypothetical protein
LIRYRIGDIGRLVFGSCSCGRAAPWLTDIGGREVDLIPLPDGSKISPYALSTVVEVRLESPSDEVYLTLDGQEGFPLTTHDVVRIQRCEEPVLLIEHPQRTYFQVLHRKLKWGERGG